MSSKVIVVVYYVLITSQKKCKKKFVKLTFKKSKCWSLTVTLIVDSNNIAPDFLDKIFVFILF